MKKLVFLSIFMTSILLLSSCSKDDMPPIITITAPTNGTTISPGQNFTVKGTITDDTELKEINIGGNVLTTFTSSTSHTLDDVFTVSATQALGNVNFEVTATDKAGNTASTTIQLIVK